MHLQTYLIISNSHSSLKNNHRSQFSNFSHPLKMLKKTDNQMLQMIRQENKDQESVYPRGKIKKNTINNKEQPIGPDNIIGSKSNFFASESKKWQITQKQSLKMGQYFNQDQGILQHLHKRSYSLFQSCKQQKKPSSFKLNNKTSTTDPQKIGTNRSKCFILFGFSIQVIDVQEFHQNHPEMNLIIKMFKYDQSQFYREVQIRSLIQEPFQYNPSKYQRIIQKLGGDDLLDCQEISFVISFSTPSNVISFSTPDNINKQRHQEQGGRLSFWSHIYFFPNVNALKSTQQKRQNRTQLTLGLNNMSQTNRYNRQHHNSIKLNCTSQNSQVTLTSLRKSHQNFRILQVLQYYLKLQCHSQHIMITSNQSRIIKQFLDLIYLQDISKFCVYIDHERKLYNKTNKSTIRSILCRQQQHVKQNTWDDGTQKPGLNDRTQIPGSNNGTHTPNFNSSEALTSEMYSQRQFVSVDGQLIINDQFLSKLSEIKLPERWLENQEFRQQKKLMYKMKIQEYQLNRQIKQMKTSLVDNINYLNSLIGSQKVTYDQISLQSLRRIKNAKIKQNTHQVKELADILKNLQIRAEQLRIKKKKYQRQKNLRDGQQKDNLLELRMDILQIQKQLNLSKNQLNAIYHSQFAQQSAVGQSSIKSNLQLKQSRSNKAATWKPLIKAKPFRQSIHSHIASPLPNQSPLKKQSFSLNPRSSQMANKYAPILQQLKKQKYDQSLKQQMTLCQFNAQKQYQKLKEQYSKATNELRLILGDCD